MSSLSEIPPKLTRTEWGYLINFLKRTSHAQVTISKEGSTYYAYKANGDLLSSGTVASTVIQAAINFVPADNWSIDIRADTYVITASIDFTGKKLGRCEWGGVTFIDNISEAAAYCVHMGTGTGRNLFSGVLNIDLATNDKKFGLQIDGDSAVNDFEKIRVNGHSTNKATIGIKLGGTGVGLANDDNRFHALVVNHCTTGIQLGETSSGCFVYHNVFSHITAFGTHTMVQLGPFATKNELKSMGLETGTRFINCAGTNNIFECFYASGGAPYIGDFITGAEANTVLLGPQMFEIPLGTDTSSLKTTSMVFVGKNPRALSTITPGASPYAYTNADFYEEDVTVGGGTVSAISIHRGGVTTVLTGITSGIFRLGPRDELRVTYSSVPTMRKIPR